MTARRLPAAASALLRPVLTGPVRSCQVVTASRTAVHLATGDPAGLAEAAGRLLDDPDRRALLSAAATVAVSRYDWSVVAKDVVNVYETVVLGANAVAVAT